MDRIRVDGADALLVTREPEGIRVSITDLVVDTGLSEREVREALRFCEADGWLSVHDFDGNAGTFSMQIPKGLKHAE